jgi:glycosyltransferase involved in cell wall biosynthesis
VSHPLVSFIIPAYNHERFVTRCLDSVLEDPYTNKEIAIINDGSTDGTAATIERWIAAHGHEITVKYRSRPNVGLTRTLNELYKMVSGDFVKLGASDDYFLPGGIQAQVEYLQAHPDKLVVIGDAIVVDNDDNVIFQSAMFDLHGADKSAYATDDGIIRQVIGRWAVSGPVPLIRREAHQIINGWNESLKFEDWDFFLRIVARNALGFIDFKVGAYRVHSANTCRVTDPAIRIRNLSESRSVAERHTTLFNEPYQTLMRAQSHLIDAKIAYLSRHPVALGKHMAAYGGLRLYAALRSVGSPAPAGDQ